MQDLDKQNQANKGNQADGQTNNANSPSGEERRSSAPGRCSQPVEYHWRKQAPQAGRTVQSQNPDHAQSLERDVARTGRRAERSDQPGRTGQPRENAAATARHEQQRSRKPEPAGPAKSERANGPGAVRRKVRAPIPEPSRTGRIKARDPERKIAGPRTTDPSPSQTTKDERQKSDRSGESGRERR